MVETTAGSSPTGFLFDTNIVIAALREEEDVIRRLVRISSDQLFIPVIALGEIYFGALKSARADENLTRFQQFAANSNILSCDETTARHYASVRDALRRRGRPIPENDLWISAISFQHNLILVSRDVHFHHVEGLHTESW